MRHPLATLAVSLYLWPLAAAPSAPAPSAPPPAPPAPAATPATSGTTGDSEDALRHAKRAACRKDARDKKLVGAQKSGYIKDCTATP